MEHPKEETLPLGPVKTAQQYFLPPMPEKIGPYKIERFLKKGGMSLLYLAKHPKTSEMAVLKVVLPKYLKSPDITSLLLKEAKILSSLDHPNIVKLYDIGEWENGLFIAMEYIEGISLHQFLKDHSLNHRRSLEILLEIAYGLAYLHEKGILHLDLKPENVLLTETGGVKLIDFGISEFIDMKRSERAEIGTPKYMSPDDKVTFASDIYSLGLIAYELYLGRLEVGGIHLELLPKKLRKIIAKALETEPKKRTKKVVDFIADILEFMKTQGEEESTDEMLDLIHTIDRVLLPPTPPNWAELEIGLAIREGTLLNSLYIDFFHFENNRFAIIFADPVESDRPDSIGPTSMLRGMVRLLFSEPGFNARAALSRLNDALYRDPVRHTFNFSLLLLEPEKNHLSFIACGKGGLAHYPEKHLEPHLFTPSNPPLGSEPNPSFNEVEENWDLESVLLLSHLPLTPKLTGQELLLSPEPLSQVAINQCFTEKAPKSTRALAVIHRI